MTHKKTNATTNTVNASAKAKPTGSSAPDAATVSLVN